MINLVKKRTFDVKGMVNMTRILAISDIHGEVHLLDALLEQVNYDKTTDQLILLGDYVDRGTNALKTLQRVMELQQDGAIVLKGNHEEMMLKALTTDEERAWHHWATRNGGDKTLLSYGFTKEEITVDDSQPFKKPTLQADILDEHVQFIKTLQPLIEYGGYVFVHAGVHPEKTIAETDPYDHIWIRDPFHKQYKGEQTVIFGHTPTFYLHEQKDLFSVYFGDNNIIGIDGGAVYGGQLNCLELPSKKTYFIKKKEDEKAMAKDQYEALIPGRIYFGGVDAIEQLEENEKIDVIYDLRAKVDGPLTTDKSIHTPIVDDSKTQQQSIEAAVKEVMGAYHNGKNVYFHCNTGRGRGGTIATAVMMELEKANTVDEAATLVKDIRPVTNVRPEFKDALKKIYDHKA